MAAKRAELEAVPRRRAARGRAARPHRGHRPTAAPGHLHLVTQAIERLEDVFVGLGFTIAEGPEVETDWHNFGALNFPPDHPARDMYDTLYVEMGEPGSHGAAHPHLAGAGPGDARPGAAHLHGRCPGRVFRQDTPDATHMPVFHQIEGLVIDRDITFADLAGTHRRVHQGVLRRRLHVAPAALLLPVHRAVGRVRHPAPRRRVAGARRLRHGAPQRPHQLRHRSRGVAGLRLRVRHRPPRRQRATASTTSASCSPTTSASSRSSRCPPMKVLLSWLREFAPFDGRPDRARRGR